MKIGPLFFAIALLAAYAPHTNAEDKTEAEKGEETTDQNATAKADESSDAVDVVAGESLYKKSCKSCHGPKAQGMASFPKLAGNSSEYIVSRLTQYRAGEKVGPNTPLMQPQAAKLSDEDIANIAGYIASL